MTKQQQKYLTYTIISSLPDLSLERLQCATCYAAAVAWLVVLNSSPM